MKSIDAKYKIIFDMLRDNGLVKVSYDRVHLNLSLTDLQILYLPCIAYFNQVVFGKRYKLFYLNTYIGKITFIEDSSVLTGIRCRVLLNSKTIHYKDMLDALMKCPLNKGKFWEIIEGEDENLLPPIEK